MRPSLRDIQLIEAYSQGQLAPEDHALFQQRLLLDASLYEQLIQQKQVYQLIRQCGRRQLRRELNELHAELFSPKGSRPWQKRILAWFGT